MQNGHLNNHKSVLYIACMLGLKNISKYVELAIPSAYFAVRIGNSNPNLTQENITFDYMDG